MKLKDLAKEMGAQGNVPFQPMGVSTETEPALTNSSLSMPKEDAAAYVALAKELGIGRCSILGGNTDDRNTSLFGPAWFIRTIGRTRPRMHPTPDVLIEKPWDYNLAIVQRLMLGDPGAAALEATWRLSGLIGLLQLVDAHQ